MHVMLGGRPRIVILRIWQERSNLHSTDPGGVTLSIKQLAGSDHVVLQRLQGGDVLCHGLVAFLSVGQRDAHFDGVGTGLSRYISWIVSRLLPLSSQWRCAA